MLSRIAKIPMLSAAKDAAIDAVLDAPAVHYTPYTDIEPITEDDYWSRPDFNDGTLTIECEDAQQVVDVDIVKLRSPNLTQFFYRYVNEMPLKMCEDCPYSAAVSGDLISREDAIMEIYSNHNYGKDWVEGMVMNGAELDDYSDGIFRSACAIASMPSSNEWIPCSERLPEIDTSKKLCDQISEEVLGTDNFGWIRHVYLTNFGYQEPTFCTVEEGMSVEVVAWMPLPKPYRMGGGAV